MGFDLRLHLVQAKDELTSLGVRGFGLEAGFEAALFSVLAGLIPAPVIAVPTSVGTGVAEGGRAALSSALASCAPGVLTVNIDNGFGAACAAIKILRMTGGGALHSAQEKGETP